MTAPPDETTTDTHAIIAALRTERDAALAREAALVETLATRTAELATRNSEYGERIQQQAATIDVLKAMSASAGDPQPVFDLITRRATELCESRAALYELREGQLDVVASHGMDLETIAAFRRNFPRPPDRSLAVGRAILERRIVHVQDVAADTALSQVARDLGGTAIVAIPLLRDGEPIGAVALNGRHPGGYSESQIALLQTFAEQAMIAIGNAETYRALQGRTADLAESLEYQTATSDVLKVISRSTFDLQPVLDTVVEIAARLCDAQQAVIYRREGELVRFVANFGFPSEFEAYHEALGPVPIDQDSLGVRWRSMVEGRIVHIHDVTAVPGYPSPAITLGKQRTTLGVPLLREDETIGTIVLARQRVEPFTERQIELVSTFADQAVIAMENARLLDEIRQRQEELRITFENMGDGVAMFDETPRLVAWNRKFQDILDLPDGVLAERLTFPDYIRYLAGRGEYGAGTDSEEQIRRLTEQGGKYHAYERVRPDGRVIEIRHNPVAGGGFVLIYADITERKRNEAEIRAARDAAEEASHTIEAAFRDLKTAQANLIQAEKMASLGQLTAGIAHEIKNPLNFVNNFAILSVELLSELKETIAKAQASLNDNQRADVEEAVGMLTSNLEKITEHGRRADGIVRSMLEHSRGQSGERRTVDLNGLVDEALNLAYHAARAQDQSFAITLEREISDEIAPIEVNPQDRRGCF